MCRILWCFFRTVLNALSKLSIIHSPDMNKMHKQSTQDRYILVWDRLLVHWERIHHERVSSFGCLRTYTATAERELGAKRRKHPLLTHFLLLLTQHLIISSFVGINLKRKEDFFSSPCCLPRAPEAILINFPLKWEMTALHCSVVSILAGGEDKITVTHHWNPRNQLQSNFLFTQKCCCETHICVSILCV